MGTIKTTNIETITGSGTLTLGQSGETISVPSGVTVNMSSATQTGVGGSTTPYMYALKNGDQSISATTWTKVTLGTEFTDSDNAFASNTFTVPSGEAGKYLITAFIRYQDLNDTSGYGYLSIANSDRSTTYSAIAGQGNSGYGFVAIACSALVSLSVGDTISVYTYSTEAATLSDDNSGMTICKMID